VVVGYILIGDHRRHIRSKSTNGGKQGQPCSQSGNRRNSLRHIPGEIPAVRPRIGQQLFLIERLGVVQGLFGGKPKEAVGLSL